ncbi:protein SNORC [Scleropages formosus]|uniref:protein SNORC n=1 Tax=Scleropages formosus TaxID=113540 RepID=UPI000878E5F2|nr:protein SNORC [Scleropages formosus]
MAAGSASTLLPLVILSLCLTAACSETVAEGAPTVAHDSVDTSSGGGAYDFTTRDPFRDPPENSFTYEYEDTTYSQPAEGEGVLGPGAIAAIVIAVILGASVLIALIVITLKKFTTA